LGISFGSINSGLPKDIVQQIVEAEKIPLKKMEERKEKIESKKTLLSDLTKKVEDVRGEVFKNKTARTLRELLLTSTNPAIIDGAVDKNVAEPGSYQIEVMQLAGKSSAISNGVEDKDNTYIGVGYIQYELPDGTTHDVYVDEEHSSLSGIAKLINSDPSNKMRATVVNDGKNSDEPWRLVITLDEIGDGNKAVFPNLYLVDGEVDIYFDSHRDAQDAKIKLDGFEIELPDNKVSDLIPGVTLDLKKAKPGDEITINIKEDSAKITEKIDLLIEKINAVLTFIKEQNALTEKSDTSRTLGGDLTLQTLESRFRTAIFSTVMTDWGPKRVNQLGIEFQRNGTIKLDNEKLTKALQENFASVAQVLTGKYENGTKTKGFIDHLDDIVSGAVQLPGGVLATRKEGLESQIKVIDSRIESKMRQIDKKEEMLKQKFARLEETISRIRTQGNGLAALGGSVTPIQQLG
jgi:flagellar hook-associated protein 2